MNQPKSALSAKMQTATPEPEAKALAVSEESLEAMMRRIISEYKAKAPETNRSYPSKPTHPRPPTIAERDAYKRGRNDARPERPLYQDRQTSQPSNQTWIPRPPYRPHGPTAHPLQSERPNGGRGNGRLAPSSHQRNGNQGRFQPRTQDRAAFGATEEDADYGADPTDYAHPRAFSASAHPDDDNWNEEDGEDRCAMMGRRDYEFNDFNEDDEDQA